MDFGTALRRFREERKLSLRELSALSGVDHAYIHRLETGDKTAPSEDVIDRLARGLKLTPYKRRLLNVLLTGTEMDSVLFDIAVDTNEDVEVIRAAATMSFRGARPTTREEWLAKLAQIKELIGDARG
nr:MAG: transcriptional regulator [Pseudomonadota bacterium]